MKTEATFFSIALTFSFSLGIAQLTTPEIEWQNTIGGNSIDVLYSIQQTFDGGYILGGESHSGISGDKTEASLGSNDYWVVKLNATGTLDWQNTIGGDNSDVLQSIQQTYDGGYILGGYSKSNISGDKTEASIGDYDYWVVKLNALGSIEWQNTIGGNDWDEFHCIQQTSDGGYILGGYSESGISGDKTEPSLGAADYWVVKLNSKGSIEWQNTIGGISYDYLNSIHQTSEGGYILGGYSHSDISGDKTEASLGRVDYWVVKLSNIGGIEWQNTIGGDNFDGLRSIQQTSDAGYILGGYSSSGISGDKTEASLGKGDYWVVKLNSTGSVEWQNTIGGNNWDYLNSIQQTTDSGYILGGWSESGISGDKTEPSLRLFGDYWVVKLNSTGTIEWQNTIGGNSQDVLLSIQQTSDGGYILGGESLSVISGDKTEASLGSNDYWVVKLFPIAADECQLPTSPSTVNITATTATLKWDAVSEAIGHKIRYKISGTSEWTILESSNNEKTLTGLTPSTEYAWQVKSICGTKPIVSSDWSEKEFFTTDDLRLATVHQQMFEIYPNPIAHSATISFYLNQESSIVMEIIDVNGKSLRMISDESFSEGNHEAIFDTESLVAGIYSLQLKTNEGVMTKKIIIE